MQCPACRSSLPTNLDFRRCPRCGAALSGGRAAVPDEVSSPSMELALPRGRGRASWLADGMVDAVELLFSPRAAWERVVAEDAPFGGRKSPPAVAALLGTALGAALMAALLVLVGRSWGVGDYVTTRRWSLPRALPLACAWPAVGWLVMTAGRTWARRMLPPSEDRAVARRHASLVGVLGAVPALLSTGTAAAWLLPEVGPVLAAAALLYAGHASFTGMARGAGMLLDLDASSRRRVALAVALPLTVLYAVAGAGGWVLLLLLDG